MLLPFPTQGRRPARQKAPRLCIDLTQGGFIYRALGIPVEMFPVLFAIPRTAGWLSQWEESLLDKEQKIARPRQVYLGSQPRDYTPMARRL